jgi:hypothetical protein
MIHWSAQLKNRKERIVEAIKQLADKLMLDYQKAIRTVLIESMEQFYGGPKVWPKGICNSAKCDDEGAVEIWNEAIARCIKLVEVL